MVFREETHLPEDVRNPSSAAETPAKGGHSDADAGGTPQAQAPGDDTTGAAAPTTPDVTRLKAVDDPDSREAKPPRADGGGVR